MTIKATRFGASTISVDVYVDGHREGHITLFSKGSVMEALREKISGMPWMATFHVFQIVLDAFEEGKLIWE